MANVSTLFERLSLALLITQTALFFCCLALFVYRRNIFPISSKWPLLTIISICGIFQLSAIILINILINSENVNIDNYLVNVPGLLILWASHLSIPIHLIPYVLRTWRVYFT